MFARLSVMPTQRVANRFAVLILMVFALTAATLGVCMMGNWCMAADAAKEGDSQYAPPSLDSLTPMLKIEWRLGPDYPMGIQESAMGCIHGKIVSAGGFTRHPLDVRKKYPEAFGGAESGFTSLTLLFDPKNESAGWTRIADIPRPARQGAAVAVVNDALYVMGGHNYDDPLVYCCTYRLQEENGQWTWQELPEAKLPWPIYGAPNGTAVIGTKIYLVGGADVFVGPDAKEMDFHSEASRDGIPVGKALLVLDTENIKAGWKRLADCPGVPKFDAAIAAAGGKVFQLGGYYAPVAKMEFPYYNAVDSWCYDPTNDRWMRLHDMPRGPNGRALVYEDRYLILVAGSGFPKTWHLDGTATHDYGATEKSPHWASYFTDTVRVYDTKTGELGTADSMLERTHNPSGAVVGDTLYTLGGEGGPRSYHPATLQIGKIISCVPESKGGTHD
jgi:hypothetical protein